MDLCIKTNIDYADVQVTPNVSILVLMDLCIKTVAAQEMRNIQQSFNPCFNGSMYKNYLWSLVRQAGWEFQSLF